MQQLLDVAPASLSSTSRATSAGPFDSLPVTYSRLSQALNNLLQALNHVNLQQHRLAQMRSAEVPVHSTRVQSCLDFPAISTEIYSAHPHQASPERTRSPNHHSRTMLVSQGLNNVTLLLVAPSSDKILETDQAFGPNCLHRGPATCSGCKLQPGRLTHKLSVAVRIVT
jgi:hypothetical protein